MLLVLSVCGPALILLMLGWYTRRSVTEDAEHELVWVSDVAREHALKVFDTHRQVAERIDDLLEGRDDAAIRGSERPLRDKVAQFIAGLPQISSVLILDRDAHPLLATGAFPVRHDEQYADRDYFTALKGGGLDSYISRVQTSRVTGATFFGWGRARHDAGGAFDGVIDIAISPEFFMSFYRTLVGEDGPDAEGRVITMIRDDGQILVRYPGFPDRPALVPPDNPFFAAVRANPDHGLYRNRSVIDAGAPERLFAFNKVPGHPVYIVAGRSLDTIRAEWLRDMTRYVLVGLPGTAALFLVTLATLRGARRERDALRRARDEMERREVVEDQLRQAQKLEAVGQLTGGVAHDFNNLLTVIQSSVDLLRRPGLPEDRRRRYVEAISETAARAAKLTAQLLAFARRQALKPEVFDVNTNVTALSEMIGTLVGSRITVEARPAEVACFVDADPNQFDTAIVNMAVNARDAMAGEGRLVLAVRPVSGTPTTRTQPAALSDFVAISLTDTGGGIAPEAITRIFEPFFTTKAAGQGTGLGLSQVFGFAKQSGGDITVDSTPGVGSTFTLYLPRVAAAQTALSRAADPVSLFDGHGTRVLVVEDNAEVGAFAIQTLTELGYVATLAVHAADALAQLDRPGNTFDVVFSDVMMPGMNGVDLAHEIRRRFRDMPVVLTSGYSEALARDGAAGFELLHKPYSIEQLSRVLRRNAVVARSS